MTAAEFGNLPVSAGHYDPTLPAYPVYPKENAAAFFYPGHPNLLRHRVDHAETVFYRKYAPLMVAGKDIARSRLPCPDTFLRHIVHKVMHMTHITTGKYSRRLTLHILVYCRPVRSGINWDSGLPRQLIFRNQPHGQKQGIAVKNHFRSGNWAAFFIHLGYHNLLHPLFAPNFRNGMG